LTFAELAAVAPRDRAALFARHPLPLLLVTKLHVPLPARPRAPSSVHTVVLGGGDARATLSEAAPLVDAADEVDDLADAEVHAVTKSARNPFSLMVTVGRAANNDIVLPAGTVSKFHASLRATPGGWILCDHGSSNGTYLDDRRLVPDQAVDLGDDAWVRFGRGVLCRFLTPSGLADLLGS
jgi:predicted component of type VI protein secretion system